MAKRARKGHNSGSTELNAYISFPGIDHLTGEIIKYNQEGVEFSYNRYGSKFRQLIPAVQIIACIGTVGSKECQVWYRTDAQTLFQTGKRDRPIGINAPVAYGDFLVKGDSPDLGVILLNPHYTKLMSKTSEGNRGRGRKKSSGDKSEKPQRKASAGGKRQREAAAWPA